MSPPSQQLVGASRDEPLEYGRNNDGKSVSSRIRTFFKEIKVNKALLPLKFSLFFFFAAGATVQPFLQVYLLQRGVTLSQLSIMYMFNPAIHFLGPAVSGIIADKIGRSKPVLVINLILALVAANGMLFIPTLASKNCSDESIKIDCHSQYVTVMRLFPCDSWKLMNNYECGINSAVPSSASSDAQTTLQQCKPLDEYVNATSAVKYTFEKENLIENDNVSCLQHAMTFERRDFLASLCDQWQPPNCSLMCVPESNATSVHEVNVTDVHGQNITGESNCPDISDNSEQVFITSFALLLVFVTVMSNCYRILDVTSMCMVKAHNSDFGKQRFWSIISGVLVSPLSAYLVTCFTPRTGKEYYEVAFYLFDVMIFLTFLAIWKLDVQIAAPGKKMWRKTWFLLKKPDVLAFSVAILDLGTTWAFHKNFSSIYLKEIGGSSLLLGLISAINGLTGLPFLVTSNWWVKKVGSVNLLLLGFIAYVILFTGYSFLMNAWYALILELHAIFTYHLLWVAVVRHSHQIAPEGLTATVISSAGGIHYGIGKGTGSLGGILMDKYDSRSAYRYMAGVSGCTFVLYGMFRYFWWKYTGGKARIYGEGEKDEMQGLKAGAKVERLTSI